MNIDKLILCATKDKVSAAKEAYRAIKAELLLNSSSKNPKPEGKSLMTKTFTIGVDEEPFDIIINELDLSIIRKQVEIREEQINMYESNSRKDLADMYKEQLSQLRELLPPDVSKEKIQEAITTSYPYGYTQIEMGKVVKVIKAMYPMADGNLIAETVKQYIQ